MAETAPDAVRRDRPRTFVLGLLAAATLIPVTLPVPVLRGLVHDRFAVSEFATSVFMAINMVGALLVAPLAGAFADRTGRVRLGVAVALALDALLFLAMAWTDSFACFLALRALEGGTHITALSLLLSIAAARARDAGRGRTMGIVGAGITLGVAIGAPLGGALGRVEPLAPLHVAAALSGATALLAAGVLRDGLAHESRPTLRAILALARRERALRIPLTYAFVDRFTVGFFTTTFPLWMKRVHDLPAPRIGILLACFLASFGLLAYPMGRLAERISRTALLAGGSAVYGGLLLGLGLVPLDWLPLAMLALGVSSAVMFVPSLILTGDVAPPAARGTALGAFNAAGSLGFVLGPLTGGAVSSAVATAGGGDSASWALGYASAFAVAGAAELLCVAITLPGLRRLVAAGRTA
ncbi:MAG: MFS transporter [Planctomycetes bacterium]|nr:MFS transporter [Planctomycetota bacterium]